MPSNAMPLEPVTNYPSEVVSLLPAQGEWTEADYLWLTDYTRHLVELNAGRLEVLSMPSERHQAVVALIFLALRACIQALGGTVLFAPFRLRLDDGRFREPDLLLLLSAEDPRRGSKFWTGADLVVEVVSPDDPARDHVVKRQEYAAAGIAEYWIVDLAEGCIEVLTLDGRAYRCQGVFRNGERVTSPVLPSLVTTAEALLG